MTQQETLEALEKNEKELEEAIQQEKNKLAQIEKKRKILQQMGDSLQQTKNDLIKKLRGLADSDDRKRKAMSLDFTKKFRQLDERLQSYKEPKRKAKNDYLLIKSRKEYMQERWEIKEQQYKQQLAEYKEQATQLRARLNLIRSQRNDAFSSYMTSKDPLDQFLSIDPIKNFDIIHPADRDWANIIMHGGYDNKYNFEINDMEEKVKILTDECRSLQQVRTQLRNKLKEKEANTPKVGQPSIQQTEKEKEGS